MKGGGWQLKRQAFTPRKKPRLLTRLQAYYPTFYNINAPLSLTICLSAEDCYRSSSKRKNRKASHKTQLCLACACWISCFCMYKNNQWHHPPTPPTPQLALSKTLSLNLFSSLQLPISTINSPTTNPPFNPLLQENQ